MTSQTSVDVDLDETSVTSQCRQVCHGKIPAFEASLIWAGFRLDFQASSLDQLHEMLEQWEKDIACLRNQREAVAS